jgi:glycosyltransferase involved in cell wall biosynthesis
VSVPTVSVVLAVYDAAWCVRRGLDSVLEQTHPVLEVLVCDDGSRDGTPDLVEQHYPAPVRVLRLPHRNASAARHAGLAEARGEWLAFLDADDWWEPNKLERQFAWLADHPEVRWLSTDGRYESEQGIERASWLSDYLDPVSDRAGDLFVPLLQRCFPLMSSMLVEREAYLAAGGIDPAVVYSHDYDLWLRLAAGFPGGVLAESLVHYWTHPGALSKNYEQRYRDDLMLLRRVAAGALRREPAVLALARERIASHCYDLGLRCLRTGRGAEGRALLREAAGSGPWARRALAALGAWLPDGAVGALKRVGGGGLRGMVQASREAAAPVREDEAGR